MANNNIFRDIYELEQSLILPYDIVQHIYSFIYILVPKCECDMLHNKLILCVDMNYDEFVNIFHEKLSSNNEFAIINLLSKSALYLDMFKIFMNELNNVDSLQLFKYRIDFCLINYLCEKFNIVIHNPNIIIKKYDNYNFLMSLLDIDNAYIMEYVNKYSYNNIDIIGLARYVYKNNKFNTAFLDKFLQYYGESDKNYIIVWTLIHCGYETHNLYENSNKIFESYLAQIIDEIRDENLIYLLNSRPFVFMTNLNVINRIYMLIIGEKRYLVNSRIKYLKHFTII